jgi:DNA-binding MarR family transcriptional regulator
MIAPMSMREPPDSAGPGRQAAAHIAAEVWRLMLEFTWGHRARVYGVLKELNLTPGDMKALMALEPDQLRPMRSLAQVWDCDASNVTWMVDRLEERGFVERQLVSSDRRVKSVALTPLGVKAKAELLARLFEPPEGLVSLPLRDLDRLRAAMARLPVQPQPQPHPHPHPHAHPPTGASASG